MTRFLADEDFNNDVLRGLQRRVAHLDVVRVTIQIRAHHSS